MQIVAVTDPAHRGLPAAGDGRHQRRRRSRSRGRRAHRDGRGRVRGHDRGLLRPPRGDRLRGRRPPSRNDQQADPLASRRALHRELRLPQAARSRPTRGEPDNREQGPLQDRIRPPVDALHPHVVVRERARPHHRPRRGHLHLRRRGQALPRRSRRPVRRPGRPRPRTSSPRPPTSRRRSSAFFPIWSYAHPKADRAGRAAGAPRARRPQQGLLHHRRRRGRRDRLEAREAVLQAHGQPR